MTKNIYRHCVKGVVLFIFLVTLFFQSVQPLEAAEKVIKWRLQDVATAGQIHFDWRTEFCDRVEKMSGGRLIIKQYPSGALIKSSEMFEAVANGAIEMGAAASPYWAGIIGRVGLMGWCIPYSYEDPRELDNFLLGPYTQTMREVTAKHGVYYLGRQLTSSYPIISTKPVNSLKDISELKIRTVGLTAHTLKEVGARTVFVPAEEIYTGLATGVFDGCTWGGPSQTDAMGLQEVCKYYIDPPVAPVCYNESIVNLEAWNKLPEDLKAIVSIAWDSISWPTYKEMETVDRKMLKDYVTNQGVIINHLSNEDINTLRAASLTVLEREVAEKDPMGKKLVDSLKEDLKRLGHIN